MSARRTTVVLSVLAAAAVLAAVAAVFLGGGAVAPPAPPAESPPPRPPAPRRDPEVVADPAPAPRPAPSTRGSKRPVARRSPPEDDTPPTAEVHDVPKGWASWARLRLVDAKTRAAVPFIHGRVALIVDRGNGRSILPLPWLMAEDGRVVVYRWEDQNGGVLPFGLEAGKFEAARLEVRIRGYEAREFASRADLAGDREVELTPAAPSVKGTVKAGPALAGKRLRMTIEPEDPSHDPRSPDARPSGGAEVPGPFAWFDVPDGRWRLDVWIRAGGDATAHAMRVFEKAGTTVDLGEVLVLPPVTILARVVARDGTGVLDNDLTIARTADGGPEKSDAIDEGGWIAFRNLDADTEYRLVSSLEGLEETVHTPPAGGGEIRVELHWDNHGVHCRIHFTVDGQDPIQWGDLIESPTLDKGAWKRDGFLEHDMGAGDYVFVAWARPVGKDKPVKVGAVFKVPDQPLWDATIDMKEDQVR